MIYLIKIISINKTKNQGRLESSEWYRKMMILAHIMHLTDLSKYFLGTDGNHYFHYTSKTTYEMAKYKCLSEGAGLISINRVETLEFVRQKYGNTRGRMWLSANNVKGGGYRWELADGSMESISNETSNWKTGEPEEKPQLCVVVVQGNLCLWKSRPCNGNYTYAFLCQILKPEFRLGTYMEQCKIALDSVFNLISGHVTSPSH